VECPAILAAPRRVHRRLACRGSRAGSRCGFSLDQLILFLAQEATESVRLTAPRDPRLMIHGLSWATAQPEDILGPCLWTVSNYDPVSGQAHADFNVQVHRPPDGNDFGVLPSKRLPSEIKTRTTRLLRRAFARTGPRSMARILTACVRDVASRDPTVGRNLLLVCLPREAVSAAERGEGFEIGTGEPEADRATFLYLPETGSSEVQRAMNFVLNGGNIFYAATFQRVGIPVAVNRP